MGNLIGQSLGRYHILEQLGEGGMATVYKAFDTRLDRDVAIKVIRTDQFPPAALERILKRFEREAKILARLSHLHIIKVIDYGEHNGAPYLVMEYLPGGTLKQRMGKPIPWVDAVRLLVPVAQALEIAHEAGLVHRDVKPSNILMTNKGQPILTDFGIAKILEIDQTSALTGTGMGVGTPEYMAPEQWKGQTSPQSDIYSLGVVFYEMVTGRKPYRASTPAAILLKQATENPLQPSLFVKNLPQKIEQVLLKMLARDPAERYSSVSELLATFETIQLNLEDFPRSVPGKKSFVFADSPVSPLQPYREQKNLQQSKTKSKRWIIGFGILVAMVTLAFMLGKILPQSFSMVEMPTPSLTATTQELLPTITNTYTLVPPTKTLVPNQTATFVVNDLATLTLTSSTTLNIPLGKWTVFENNCGHSYYFYGGLPGWSNDFDYLVYNIFIYEDGIFETSAFKTALLHDGSRKSLSVSKKTGTWTLENDTISFIAKDSPTYIGIFDGKSKLSGTILVGTRGSCWSATYVED